MTEKNILWLTYHLNIETMFYTALEQLQHIDQEEFSLVNTSMSSSLSSSLLDV